MRTVRVGEKIYIINIPEYARGGKICKVTKVFIGAIFYKPLRFRGDDLQTTIENVDFVEDECFTSDEKREIIIRLSKEKPKVQQDWIREFGAFNKLYLMYPNIEFWRTLNFKYTVKSLLWFVGGGKDDMRKMYNMYISLDSTVSKPTIVLSDSKLGEDIQPSQISINYLDI